MYVDIWTRSLVLHEAWPGSLRDCLSAQEQGRADRLRHAQDRQQFMVAHAMLRHLLADHAGCAPQQLVLHQAPGGKPMPLRCADGRWLHYNLSHTWGWMAVALASACPVGVDIESLRPIDDLDGLVRTAFSAAERQAWQQLRPAQRSLAFFVGWTRKEAWLKATGAGLVGDDGGMQVSFALDDARPLRPTGGMAAGSLASVQRGGLLVSAAALQAGLGFRWHCWDRASPGSTDQD